MKLKYDIIEHIKIPRLGHQLKNRVVEAEDLVFRALHNTCRQRSHIIVAKVEHDCSFQLLDATKNHASLFIAKTIVEHPRQVTVIDGQVVELLGKSIHVLLDHAPHEVIKEILVHPRVQLLKEGPNRY